MQGVVTMSLFLFIILHVTGLYITVVLGDCPIKPINKKCNHIDHVNQSCITEAQNGMGLNWFQMEDACAVNEGRLVLLRDDFKDSQLRTVLQHLNNTSFNFAQFLVIGMVMSLKGDNKTFWITPRDNRTFSCGSDYTGICLSSSASEEHCNSIGCCWVNKTCQYPEHQWLTESNESAAINTDGVIRTTERICVRLERNGNSSWIQKAYNCSSPALNGTGYVCEYKCRNDWPAMSQQNVSWTRNTSTTTLQQVNTSTESTPTGSISQSTPVVTVTGNTSTTTLQQVNTSTESIPTGSFSQSTPVVTVTGNTSTTKPQQVNTSTESIPTGSFSQSTPVVTVTGNTSTTKPQQVDTSTESIPTGSFSQSTPVVTVTGNTSTTKPQQVNTSTESIPTGSFSQSTPVVTVTGNTSTTKPQQVNTSTESIPTGSFSQSTPVVTVTGNTSTTTLQQVNTSTESNPTGSFSQSTSVITVSVNTTSTGRHNTAATFKKQVMHTVYFGLLPLIYKMTVFTV